MTGDVAGVFHPAMNWLGLAVGVGIAGAVLLSPPLHRTSEEELRRCSATGAP